MPRKEPETYSLAFFLAFPYHLASTWSGAVFSTDDSTYVPA